MPANQSLEPVTFDFDLTVFRLTAIKKAAYRFAAHFDVSIERTAESRVRISMVPRSTLAAGACDPTTFSNEVLDQELREVVAEETKGVRDLLLAQTFSQLPLTDPVGEEADYREDPLGIADPSHGGPRPPHSVG